MAPSFNIRYITFFLIFVPAISVEFHDKDTNFSFSFNKFEKNPIFGSEIAINENTELRNSKVLVFSKGMMIYKKPIKFIGTTPSFSSHFVSSVYGTDEILEFFMVPNNMSSFGTNGFLAVKFVSGIYVEIDIGDEVYAKSKKFSELKLDFNSSRKLHSWIEYDGVSKKIEVRVGIRSDIKHSSSLVSCTIDLAYALWRDSMHVGISSLNGNASIYSWSFETKHGAPFLMHSVPLDPESISLRANHDHPIHAREYIHWKIVLALLVGVVFGAIVASVVFILRSKVVMRHPVTPFEIDCETNDKMKLDESKFQCVNAK